MNSHVVIRPMKVEDVPAVAKLEAATFSMPWSEKAFLEEVEREDRLFVIAVCDQELAGYMGLIPSFDEADITNVAVAPSMRRRGIAEKMLKTAMNWAGEREALMLLPWKSEWEMWAPLRFMKNWVLFQRGFVKTFMKSLQRMP